MKLNELIFPMADPKILVVACSLTRAKDLAAKIGGLDGWKNYTTVAICGALHNLRGKYFDAVCFEDCNRRGPDVTEFMMCVEARTQPVTGFFAEVEGGGYRRFLSAMEFRERYQLGPFEEFSSQIVKQVAAEKKIPEEVLRMKFSSGYTLSKAVHDEKQRAKGNKMNPILLNVLTLGGRLIYRAIRNRRMRRKLCPTCACDGCSVCEFGSNYRPN